MPDDQNAGNTTDQGSTTNDAPPSNSDASGDQGTGTGDAAPPDSVTRVEFDRLMERMRAADQRASKAEEKVKEIERKDQSELDRTKSDLAERDKKIEELTAMVDQMTLQNEFLTSNKYAWHDPSDALRLLDMEGVEIRDGKVTGLVPAIDKLAKNKPHLVKVPDKDSGGSSNGSGSTEASGSANNGNRKGDEKKDKKDYSGRFPALKRP